MNEILQKRIKEAANHYLLHEHKSPLNEILHQCDLKTEMQYHRDIEQAYIEGGKNSLQNQWISVEEALPERGSVVFIRFDHGGYSVRMFTNYDRSFADVKGGNITHWMPIPSLEGGEK